MTPSWWPERIPGASNGAMNGLRRYAAPEVFRSRDKFRGGVEAEGAQLQTPSHTSPGIIAAMTAIVFASP